MVPPVLGMQYQQLIATVLVSLLSLVSLSCVTEPETKANRTLPYGELDGTQSSTLTQPPPSKTPTVIIRTELDVEATIAAASGALMAEVVRVVDGDTIDVVFSDGSNDRVRLLGVDTPETFQTNKPGEYGTITDTTCLDDWGREATKFATGLLMGETVELLLDPVAGGRGSFGRLLAYVLVSGEDSNSILVRRGYARVYEEGKAIREGEYLDLQRQAQDARIGLWGCSSGRTTPTAPSLSIDFPYDPSGPDRDCGDFFRWQDAQDLYLAAGGPGIDPHRLDGDRDGVACESLSGAP